MSSKGPAAHGMKAKVAASAAVLCVGLASCTSSTPDASRTSAADMNRFATEVLQDANEFGLWGTPTPQGGYVAFGVPAADGRVSKRGVVFDAKGQPTSTFVLPERIVATTSVMIGDELLTIGLPCDAAPAMDEMGELLCEPGAEVGYIVDVASEKVQPLELPTQDADRRVEPRSWMLYRVGDRALLVASQAGSGPDRPPPGADPSEPLGLVSTDFVAWLRDGATWSPVERPVHPVCQAGDAVLEDVTAQRPIPARKAGSPSPSPVLVTPTVRIFEPRSGEWSTEFPGPEVSVVETGVSSACSQGWITFLARQADGEGADATTSVVSFDIAARHWTGVKSPHDSPGMLWPVPFPDAPYLLLDQTRSGEDQKLSSEWLVLDPATGSAVDPGQPIPKNSRIMSASDRGILTFDPNAKPTPLKPLQVK